MQLKVRVLKSFREKSIGLIGADPPYPVFFTTRWGIHTFGMKVPIDVLILDETFRVVRLVRSLPPNRFFFWNPRYRNVLELPEGLTEVSRGGFIGITTDTRWPDPSR